MEIEVTAEDIEAGIKGDPLQCPVSIALERATGFAWSVGVDFAYSKKMLTGKLFWDVPLILSDWIRSYDRDHIVDPIRFDIPEEYFK